MESAPSKKRTVWIWLIAIWFFVGAALTLASFFAVKSGAILLNENQRSYFDSLGAFDHMASILIAGSNLLGAVFLLLLRKAALQMFLAALSVNVLLTAWHIATKGLAAAISGGLLGIVLGLGLLSAVCAYTWKLKKRQVLS